ncbi:Dipeptide and tripeptide permease A [Pirellulimonas nuda]|uniref:Dipeptide and tripeptide permease A n=1 Tax=Pirellulimonas nuda TaxID=2528009 RepID=A0A518DEN4_9BACT|nr:POT family MFS transporter [Pirellulimonas nuda]QDU89940.1 Dipeptide and tripeptide permease A [Pirellulimonas nuda]
MSDSPYDPPQTEPAAAPTGGYRTTPDDTAGIPPGIPYIIGNEAAERFSFYGMRAILYVFMTEYLLRSDGSSGALDETTANIWYHNFVTAAYFFPVMGALLSDWLLGKYRTIILLSLVYCVGHAAMAMVDFPSQTGISPKTMLVMALTLIAVGTGGIKPCVSAHVGDQFGPRNKGLMARVFTWFYFSINFGSAISTLLTPKLLEWYGPGVAFGVPGVLMFMATVLFWSGRNRFVHVPPTGNRLFAEIVSRDGLRAIANLTPLFILIAVFWSLFDQTSSTWVEQAKHMDRSVFGLELNPSQNQATNPILILLLIPVFGLVIYPQLGRLVTLTPLRKIGIGLFLTVPSFVIPAYVQRWIDAGETPHIGWQILAYLVITAAEIMVSITALEFSYTQAPRTLKSFIMGLFLLSVALGNKFTAFVNEVIQSQRAAGVEILEGENYYWFFAAAMLGTAVLYVLWSQFYRGQTYIQGEGD